MNKHTLKVVYEALFGAKGGPKVVYDGMFHTNDLEAIFRAFNAVDGSPEEMTSKLCIRSMSVGDKVCLDGQWFQCSNMGWAKLATA
jgi:hypothetical protein